jgi:hypothetical protein
MSAKSVQGPGGKKPASAATNLIGKLEAIGVLHGSLLTSLKLVEAPE